MRLSARNQLHGTVAAVEHGKVMSSVKVTLPDGQAITAAITREAAEELGLAPGTLVVAVIKATEVMIGLE